MILSKVKIGFLGGGQLARMMILECHKLGLSPRVYCESNDDPAAQVCSNLVLGSLNDQVRLNQFLEEVDLLTFESEFAPKEILKNWLQNQQQTQKIFPSPSCMIALQNRDSQKTLLQENKISTADHVAIHSPEDLKQAWQKWKRPFVIKKNFGGYDGYGTYFIDSPKDLDNFLKTHSWSEQGYIAEKKIRFKRELAVIFARNHSGKFISLPLVETHQNSGKCDWVSGPLKHKKFPELEKKFQRLLQQMNYVGCLGVEIFDTGSELFVNELAPRVHNSGHYSQEALVENQFMLHIKSGLNLPLKPAQLYEKAFAMVNLIGSCTNDIAVPENLNGQLHLYGKKNNRSGRKMGHLNFTGSNRQVILRKALLERKKFKL